MLSNTLRAGSVLTASLLAMPTALAQTSVSQVAPTAVSQVAPTAVSQVAPTAVSQVAPTRAMDTPQTRLRPIGAPSVVDQFRSADAGTVQQTAADGGPSPVESFQQTVFMQNGVAPVMPNNGGMALPNNFSPPPISTAPLSAPPATLPPTTAPRTLPASPGLPVQSAPRAGTFGPGSVTAVPNQDYAPLAQPQLNNQFATMSNSCHVSGPSSYTAASASGCAQVGYQAPPAYVATPAPIAAAPVAVPITPPPMVPPTTVVPSAPIVANPTGAPAGSLITFGQEKYQVQVGQGLWGQPVAYVPGQKFRNCLRYIFP